MERLTFKETDGKRGIVGMNKRNEKEKLLESIDKLIAYEETGIEPEEAEKLKKYYDYRHELASKHPGILQCIQDSLVVQIELRVVVDGLSIRYTRLPDNFAYEFVVNGVNNQDEIDHAHSKIEKVVKAMINQSFDHGCSWRVVDTISNREKVERYHQYIEIVNFRIRDAG